MYIYMNRYYIYMLYILYILYIEKDIISILEGRQVAIKVPY